jgi:hypothetical protein
MEVFLRAKGFRVEKLQNGERTYIWARLSTEPNPQKGLFAVFDLGRDPSGFFVGKGNSRSFTDEERRIVDEFIAFLFERSRMIRSGSASRASSSKQSRSAFYAKIKNT